MIPLLLYHQIDVCPSASPQLLIWFPTAQSILASDASFTASAYRHDMEVPGDDRVSGPDRCRARHEAARTRQSSETRRRREPIYVRLGTLSVRFTDEILVPMRYRTVAARLDGALWERLIESVLEELKRPLVASIQEAAPGNEAIKNAVQNQIAVPGAEVYRGDHLRVG
jgi:hypothetical protein